MGRRAREKATPARERIGGIHAVSALLAHGPEQITQLWLREREGRLASLANEAEAAGLSVQLAAASTLTRLADDEHHQGVVAEFRPRQPVTEADLMARLDQAGRSALVLVLDEVQDPRNLGACLRSAAAAGASAVVAPRSRSAPLTAAARRSAAGAAERLPLAIVPNLARCLNRLGEAGLWRVGLSGQAETSLYAADLAGPLALVLGSEEKGLRRLTAEHCDQLAAIPMPGGMESLNVSVAAGIGLFEAVRQRQ